MMDVLLIVGGILGLLTANNVWKRLMWWMGFRPLFLNEDQAHIASKWAAREMVCHAKRIGMLDPATLTPDVEEDFVDAQYCFARAAIDRYCRKLELPSYDATPDTPAMKLHRKGA